ncbi:MAG: hypothetical protein ABI791_15760 [Acidobacteriota bacterium]
MTSVTTVAGFHREFAEPFGLAFRDGSLYVSDGDAGKILKVRAAGETAVFAEGLKTPSAIAFASDGSLIVADTGDHAIKRIDAAGTVTLVAGILGTQGNADGPAASATFNAPIGVAVGRDDRILVADTYNDRVRVIENGNVRTISGSSRGFADGAGASAKFDTPTASAELANGTVLVCDSQNARIRLIEPDGSTSTLAASGEGGIADGFLDAARFSEPTAITVGTDGDVYVADGDSIRVIRNGAFPFVRTIAGGRRGFADGRIGSAQFNRPSGLAYDSASGLFVADSDDQVVRLIGSGSAGRVITSDEKHALRYTAEEFRELQPPRWPFDPPHAVREIAGTLGEIRGAASPPEAESHFHNGLDIAGGYGEQTRIVRTEKVLLPIAAENFGTSRELIRLPTLGYIHVRLGRKAGDAVFDDPRFQFTRGEDGKLSDVRVPRGTVFTAGEILGTLNAMNHVHLVAGRSGAEINALAALDLPGVSDTISPVIEDVEIFDENWRKNETQPASHRIELKARARVVVRGYDRVDGNAERRRLGVYKVGFRLSKNGSPETGPIVWNIKFDRMSPEDAVRLVYAPGSKSGATGETIFNYIVTNTVSGDTAAEGFVDPATLESGEYTLEVFAADYFGNTTTKSVGIEVLK